MHASCPMKMRGVRTDCSPASLGSALGSRADLELPKKEGASQPARSLSCLIEDPGPGGQIPTRSASGRLAPNDDGVAFVAAGVDIADGDGPAIGLAYRGAAVARRRVATVARGATGSTGRGVAVAAVSRGDRRATIGADVDRRLVGDRAAVDRDIAAVGIADHDGVATVSAGVD